MTKNHYNLRCKKMPIKDGFEDWEFTEKEVVEKILNSFGFGLAEDCKLKKATLNLNIITENGNKRN